MPPIGRPNRPENSNSKCSPTRRRCSCFGYRNPQIQKGRLAERRPELEKLRQYQLSVLPTLEPALAIGPPDLPTIPQTGAAMKAVEDQLDSLTCAYAAAHWWYWGTERNWVLGNVNEGYIVVPAPSRMPPPY
jgi:predicted RNase H-like nuclease